MRTSRFIYFVVLAAGTALAQDIAVEDSDAALPAKTQQSISAEATDALQSDRVTLLLEAAKMYSEEGEYDAAERAYLKALEEEPDNQNVEYALSVLYILTGRSGDAIDILTVLIAGNDDNPVLHNNLAWAYSSAGKYRDGKKALFHAREAILLAPQSASMWNTLAEAYYISGLYEKALKVSDHAMILLRETQPDENTFQQYAEQHQKILRAKKAMDLFDGVDE